jgi:type IX secretion system PorP/SprF family membrane protein
LAYHTPLTRSRKVYLALGVQGGLVNNRLDRTGALGQDGILSSTGTGTNDLSLIRDDISSSYPDFGAGILLNFILSQKFNFNLGFSSRHLLEPEDKFTAKNYNRARTFLGNIGFNIDLTRKLTFMPQAMFAYNSSANQLNAQALLGYHLNSARDITFVFGGGVRHHIFGDGTQIETGISAAIARIGLNYKNIKAGLAYDFVTNSLSGAPGRRDAIELAVIYTGKILPKKYLPPRILCPRF